MLVYVIQENKSYQLVPKKISGEYVTAQDWENAGWAQKVAWLDPLTGGRLQGIYDGDADADIPGTGNADDAWKEVSLEGFSINQFPLTTSLSGSELIGVVQTGENKKVTFDTFRSTVSSIEVIDTTIGGYKDGDMIETGTQIETILKKLLQTTVNQVYVIPTLTISIDGSNNVEIGTMVTSSITGVFEQHNAGALTSYEIYSNDILARTTSSTSVYTDTLFAISSNTTYKAKAFWSQGGVLLNNMGEVSPGQIAAGSMFSNTITLNAVRKTFYGADTATSAVATSTEVRNLPSGVLNIEKADNFTIVVPIGTKRITFAYPETLGSVTSVKYNELNYEVKDTFTSQTISVAGADEQNAISYKVYTYITNVGFSSAVTYTITV